MEGLKLSKAVYATDSTYHYTETIVTGSSIKLFEVKRYDSSQQWNKGYRHNKKRNAQSNQCDSESINDELVSCQDSVTITNAHMSDPSVNLTALLRTQFCGIGCRTKMFLHARQCEISSYIVEVTGDCSNNRETNCIHAAVIMLDGILWCSIELDRGHMNGSEEATLETDIPTASSEEKKDNNSSTTHQCNLSTYYSTTVNHRFLYDKLTGRQVLSPPLEPPWQNCSAFGFSNMSMVTTTDPSINTSAPKSSSLDPNEGQTASEGSTKDPVVATTNSSLRHISLSMYSLIFMSVMCSLVLSKVFL